MGLGVGVGLRAPHYRAFLDQRPPVDWLEVHTENYLNQGGWDLHVLTQLRQHYPVSLHGVGLGIGSAQGFSVQHLQHIKNLVQAIEPVLVSEHLCWASVYDRHMNDLLPLPLRLDVLALVCQRVDQLQTLLGCQILLENVSSSLRFRGDEMSEAQMLAEVAARTGCGILLDVNNLYVNQCNHQENALAAIQAIALGSVGEIHLAGHMVTLDAVIDHHGDRVAAPVWELYRQAVMRFGPVPTLIEWDTDLPALDVLLDEARRAREISHASAGNLPPTLPRGVMSNGSSGLENVQSGRSLLSLPVLPVPEQLAAQQLLFSQVLFRQTAESTMLSAFEGEPDLVRQRFALYRGNLSATWRKTLCAAYPVLQVLVGEEFFDGLAGAYGQARPSASGDLNCFGEHFAEFLNDFSALQAYPYFPDMARLEWAYHRAHFACNAPVLGIDELSRLVPAQLEEGLFTLHSGCRLLAFSWDVAQLWLAHQPHCPPPFPEQIAGSSHAMVVRAKWQPEVMKLTVGAYAALLSLQQGHTLGNAVDSALQAEPGFDLGFHLQQWMQHGVFSALSVHS